MIVDDEERLNQFALCWKRLVYVGGCWPTSTRHIPKADVNREGRKEEKGVLTILYFR